MSFLQAFVYCFIAYLLYKIIKPSGITKKAIEKLKCGFMKASAIEFKKANIKNKATVASNYEDLRSCDPIRIEQAIARIDAVFDEEIQESDSLIAKYNDSDKDKS